MIETQNRIVTFKSIDRLSDYFKTQPFPHDRFYVCCSITVRVHIIQGSSCIVGSYRELFLETCRVLFF